MADEMLCLQRCFSVHIESLRKITSECDKKKGYDSMETRWLYNTSETLQGLCKASNGVCVIPMGCVEKHGLHLPLGQDIIQASHLAYMASQLETVCVFPDFIFGDCPGKVPYSAPYGNIALPLEMQMALLEQLCIQISDNGFKKILVYNAHGGNLFWLPAFTRNLPNKDFDFVFATLFTRLNAPHIMAEILEKEGSGSIPELTKEDEELLIKYHKEDMLIGHACMGETAFMMGINPEAVHMDRLGVESGKDQRKSSKYSEAGLDIENYGWALDFPNVYAGDDPIGCNERIGKASLRIEAERMAKAFKIFKEDEDLIKWQESRRWK